MLNLYPERMYINMLVSANKPYTLNLSCIKLMVSDQDNFLYYIGTYPLHEYTVENKYRWVFDNWNRLLCELGGGVYGESTLNVHYKNGVDLSLLLSW